ncbi:MAG TPA: sporulation protein YpjB [Bacillota bacterium]|nr:sporulation protein YpjB [Compostibacillus humi]HLT57114.1 sporulation protein YpjB [Bacillota bacterium]
MIRRKLHQMVCMLAFVIGILTINPFLPQKIFASPAVEDLRNTLEWTPFALAVLIIGGSIGLTLIYVSWKKYRGSKKSFPKKDKMID